MRKLSLMLLLMAATAATASDVVTKYETVKVADGVYAFIAPEPKSALVNGNSVAIIGDDGVVVVDSGQIPSLTRRMIGEIKALTDKPVRAVVITHWHWDHNIAAFAYREAFPHVAILSTPFTRQMLVDTTPTFLKFFREQGDGMLASFRKQQEAAKTDAERANYADDVDDLVAGLPEVRSAQFVAPNQTVDSETSVFLGKREVRIFHPGRANTAGDLVVYVPDAKVLITGDIVVWPTPYATSAYLTDWIGVLKRLSAMDFVALVPGHGPVQRNRAYLDTLTGLLQSTADQVNAAVREGLSLEATAKKVDLEPFRKKLAGDDRRRNRFFAEYYVKSAIETQWKQARGEKTSEAPF